MSKRYERGYADGFAKGVQAGIDATIPIALKTGQRKGVEGAVDFLKQEGPDIVRAELAGRAFPYSPN